MASKAYRHGDGYPMVIKNFLPSNHQMVVTEDEGGGGDCGGEGEEDVDEKSPSLTEVSRIALLKARRTVRCDR